MSAGSAELPEGVRRKIERERRQLQKASAILQGAVAAANEGICADIVADAVIAARELIDAADEGLDIVELNRARKGGAS